MNTCREAKVCLKMKMKRERDRERSLCSPEARERERERETKTQRWEMPGHEFEMEYVCLTDSKYLQDKR